MGDIKFWIIFVIALVVCIVGTKLWKNHILKKLLVALQKEDYDSYFKTLDSISCKYFYPAFNREYMRMNAFMMKGDIAQIHDQFDLLLHMRLNKKQEADVVVKAFYFYVDEENKGKTKELLTRMSKCAGQDVLTECTIIYDIFICKSCEHMEAMEEAVQTAEGANRGMFNFMLALQYGYQKDMKKRKQLLEIALQDLKGTPYEMKIKQMMKQK